MRLRKKEKVKGMVSHTHHPALGMMKHEDHEFEDSLSYFCFVFFKIASLFVVETGSHYLALAGLKFTM